jgi:hypothetical protein
VRGRIPCRSAGPVEKDGILVALLLRDDGGMPGPGALLASSWLKEDAKGVSAMDPKDTRPTELDDTAPSDAEPEHEKHRRHGYRGYPNNPNIGGDIHTGSGFAGVGSTAEAGSGQGILTEKTRESIEELGDEEKDEE